ncbi:DUF6082 family protein [Streptomyces sp. enrichment culture]|uniref:DUF6082 family protein n=1 Tax=Streptomyces sp. enrichment culture TaxID=1795815 RepID=UPI003F54BD57
MDHRRFGRALLWGVAALLGVALVGAASVVISGWLLTGVEEANGGRREAAERSAVGDYFGGISAVFSGLALLLLVFTLLFQQRELRLQREELRLQRQELIFSRQELRRSARADLRALHVQLTEMAMDDPTLAAVWNDYPDEPHEVVRQHLFANLVFGHYLLFYEWGEISEEELLEYARTLLSSPLFQRYWEASRGAKEGLSPDSHEGRLFRIFEQAIRDLQGGGSPRPS